MVLWRRCFAKFMVVLPNISLQILQCDYAHIRVVLTQWLLRGVHPTNVSTLPSSKAEALMCLDIGGSWPSANLVIFLRFKGLHSPSSLFESVQPWSPYLLNPMHHICSKFLWSQISLSQQHHNKRLKLIQNDWRKIHSWILKHVWRFGAFQPIGNLADYLYNWKTSPRKKKKRIELMRGRFSGPSHLPRIFPSFPLNQWDFHQPDKFWKDGSSCRSAGCPAKC